MSHFEPSYMEVAAFHGLALNKALTPKERLECALKALALYEDIWPVVEAAIAYEKAWSLFDGTYEASHPMLLRAVRTLNRKAEDAQDATPPGP